MPRYLSSHTLACLTRQGAQELTKKLWMSDSGQPQRAVVNLTEGKMFVEFEAANREAAAVWLRAIGLLFETSCQNHIFSAHFPASRLLRPASAQALHAVPTGRLHQTPPRNKWRLLSCPCGRIHRVRLQRTLLFGESVAPQDASPGGLKAVLGLTLLAGVLGVFVGRRIGEHIGHPSAFEVAHGINWGRIAGGIYGALFASISAGVAALRYRWLALLIGLAVGAMGAALGAFLETH